jgi:hypothetical protein
MQHGNNRPDVKANPLASSYFQVPPGIGWRTHVSKLAAEMRVASLANIATSRRAARKR